MRRQTVFGVIQQKVSAARTLSALCRGAEAEARQDGQPEPGAEHFVLAAFSLPDGSAERVFNALGASEAELRTAIARQYAQPLRALGLQTSIIAEPLAEAHGVGPFQAAPSARALVQALAARSRKPLTGARVLEVAAEQSEGVFARAMAVMGLDLDRLRKAAEAV